MAINFPTSLDSFDNVTNDTDVRNTHPTLHNDINDAVEKLQEKVGIDSSANANSLDYKVTNLDTTKFDTADFDTYFDTALATKDTGDLSEGINLYYTQARFDTAFGLKDTGDLTEGTNLYYTEDRFDTRLATKDTDDLSEGLSNLYYTETRVSANTDVNANTGARHNAVTVLDSSEIDFTLTGQQITASLKAGSIDETKLDTSVNESLDLADSSLQSGDNISLLNNNTGYITNISTFDTGDLTEGTNLYYTQDRFDTAFGLKTTTNLTEGTNLYYTEARVSANTDVSANTSARHTHSNKTNLDEINQDLATTDDVSFNSVSATLNGIDKAVITKLYQPDGTNPFVYTDNGGSLHIDGDITQSGST
ncbi:MAG: hypothetical protein EOL88_15140, partial [Bacteroidia bacterium]|nr:hypothetical protein [Bacteroidia bacterium]